MKRAILAISAALFLSGCTSKIEQYIRDKEPNIISLEIIEVSKEDSAYSPYNTLLSLSVEYASLGADISNLENKAMQEKSKEKVVEGLNNAIKQYEKEETEISKIFFNCCRYVNLPSICEEPFNRKFVNVKYRLNGKLIEQRFFFNKDGKSIGHTDADIKKIAKAVEKTAFEALSTKMNIIEDRRSIRGY